MNIAAVAIEHVLTGLLALAAFVLPFWNPFAGGEASLGAETIVGLIGLAYLWGVVFDKLTDTVLSPWEQWIRLGIAKQAYEDRSTRPGRDPFPQDALEFALRQQGGARVEWMDSLRSRIRTCRGLAVLGVPAAIAATTFARCEEPHWRASLVILTLVLFTVSVALSHLEELKLPKTSLVDLRDPGQNERTLYALRARLAPFAVYVLVSIASVSHATLRGEWASQPQTGALAIGGIALSLAALWSWSRITKTYMGFVASERLDA